METTSVKVQINWFGQLSELAGSAEESVEIKSDSTVQNLIEQLSEKNPELKTIPISAAVNNEMATADQKLSDADHVDLFPPYSGG